MEISAKVYKVGETQQVTEKFKKRELIVIIDAGGSYPQHIKVQLSQDKCELADTITPGDDYVFSVNLRGKLYTDKNGNENAITNLEVWRVNKIGSAEASGATSANNVELDEASSDLPF